MILSHPILPRLFVCFSMVISATAQSKTVREFGATGDGTTDDTVAIQKALDYAYSGIPITLDGGTYAHSGVLHIRAPGTVLSGPGVLLATHEATSALHIAAPDVTVSDLTVQMGTTTKRWDVPMQAKIHLDQTINTNLTRVTVHGSAASGVFIQGCAGFTLTEVEVTGTRADAIHMTGGSHDGSVIRPIVNNPGDDGVAIVSYLNDGVRCHHITVISPRLYGQKWGRAFSVVGGRDITFSDVYSDGSGCAAIYIAAEKSWNTDGCQRITFDGGTLLNSNQVVTVDHGAVLVFNGQSRAMPNLDITIRNMLIRGTRSSASRQLGVVQYGDAVQARIAFDGITIEGGGNLWGSNAPPSVYTRTNWTWNGQPVPGTVTP